MRKIKLTSTCNITTGKMDANAATESGIYPFFTCAPEPLKIDTYAFDGDVILLAGNNASGNFHCQRYNGKFNAYQRTYVITAKEGFDIDYIFFNLLINLRFFKKIAQGSQTKFLTMDILNGFELEDVPYSIQKKLVKGLKFLNQKIAINTAICSDLESIAKLLYDYWFVQFDFPDENGKPYKSSGGKMVWNKELKREIPEGWEVKTLADVFDITMGSSPAGNSLNECKEGIEFYQGSTDFGELYPTERVYTTAPVRYAKAQDVLMSVRAPVGDINIAMNDCCIGRGLAAIHHESTMYVWCVINSFRPYFDIFNGNGTTFGALTSDDLKGQKTIAPPVKILEKLIYKMKPIEGKLREASIENQQLVSLRDFLLPMLMNGQVKVGKED